MTVLLTGFSAFPGVDDNPTETIAKRLDGALPGTGAVVAAVLETRLDGLHQRVDRLLAAHRPRAILLTGVAEARDRLYLETHAWNRLDFPRPDAAGHLPAPAPIDRDGPAAIEGRFDKDRLGAALSEIGAGWAFSDDPGRYLCNALYYMMLRRSACPCVFLHVPLHAEAGGATPLAEIEAAVRALLKVKAAS